MQVTQQKNIYNKQTNNAAEGPTDHKNRSTLKKYTGQNNLTHRQQFAHVGMPPRPHERENFILPLYSNNQI